MKTLISSLRIKKFLQNRFLFIAVVFLVLTNLAQATSGGYQLFFNGKLVSGPDAVGYTLQQAQQNCDWNIKTKPQISVACAYNGVLFYPTQQAQQISVEPRIGAKCVPVDVGFTVPAGMVAKGFAVNHLGSGINCGTSMPIPEKGFKICGAEKLVFWYQIQPNGMLNQGGITTPLAALTLGAGSYEFQVNGGEGAGAKILFSLVPGTAPALPANLQACVSRNDPQKRCSNPFEENCIVTPKF